MKVEICEHCGKPGDSPACDATRKSRKHTPCSSCEALQSRVAELEAALTEICGCFEAAVFEGLLERMEGEDADIGSLTDLIRRRLIPAAETARKALEPK